MCSAHQIQIKSLQEAGHDILAKREGNASVILSPALGVLVRVTPQKIAKQALVRDVGGSHDSSNLIHGCMFRGKAAMGAENLFVHDGGYGQAVKDVAKRLP